MTAKSTKPTLSESIATLAGKIRAGLEKSQDKACKTIVDSRAELAVLVTETVTTPAKELKTLRRAFVRLSGINRVQLFGHEIGKEKPVPVPFDQRTLELILGGLTIQDAAETRARERQEARELAEGHADKPFQDVNRALAAAVRALDAAHHHVPAILAGPRGKALAMELAKYLEAAERNEARGKDAPRQVLANLQTLSLRESQAKVRSLKAPKTADPSKKPARGRSKKAA